MFKKTRGKIKAKVQQGVDKSAIKGVIDEAKRGSSAEQLYVDESVSREEFVSRYKTMSVTCYMAIAAFVYCMLYSAFSEGLQAFLISFGAGVLVFLLYLKTAYSLWVARKVFSQWEKRNDGLKFTFRQFTQELVEDYRQLWPIKIY